MPCPTTSAKPTRGRPWRTDVPELGQQRDELGVGGAEHEQPLLARGGLGPYCGGSALVFRCPSDRVLSDLQRGAGWSGRTRSISMNAMVGDAGTFTREGRNVNNPYYRQFFRLAQVPQPAEIFVFIDEHPDSINDGYSLNSS